MTYDFCCNEKTDIWNKVITEMHVLAFLGSSQCTVHTYSGLTPVTSGAYKTNHNYSTKGVENDASAGALNRRMTMTFDLLTPKVDRFVPLPRWPRTCTNFQKNRFIRFQNIVFTILVTNERTGRTEGWTNGEVEVCAQTRLAEVESRNVKVIIIIIIKRQFVRRRNMVIVYNECSP